MATTFSSTFKSSVGDKKFYFKPSVSGIEPVYDVHINSDKEVKKFRMEKNENDIWKIKVAKTAKIPVWVFELEEEFNTTIVASLA